MLMPTDLPPRPALYAVSYEDHSFGKHNMAAKTFRVLISCEDFAHDSQLVVPFGACYPPQPR